MLGDDSAQFGRSRRVGSAESETGGGSEMAVGSFVAFLESFSVCSLSHDRVI